MRSWQFWWRTLLVSAQSNPSWFVELAMIGFAWLLLLRLKMTAQWPYLVLSVSYAVGASASIWVREAIAPSSQKLMTRLVAVLLLVYSIYALSDIVYYIR